MTHDFVTRLTRDGKPFFVCRVCGTTFPAETPLETVNASQCVKVKRYDTPLTNESDPSHISHSAIYTHIRETGQINNGTRLLDAWRRERGEI